MTEVPKLRPTHFAIMGGLVAAAAALYMGHDIIFPEADASTIPTPDDLSVASFKSFELLLAQIYSGHVDAESLFRLHNVVEYRLRDLDALIAAMEEVSPSNSNELLALKHARIELAEIDSLMDKLIPELRQMDQAGVPGYRVNIVAGNASKLFPHFDVDRFEHARARVIELYDNVTYGEVLVTDANGNLVEKNLRDLLVIGRTSDKLSPALAHRLMEIFGNTTSGSHGWQLNAGAFEHAGAHGEHSDHIRSPQALNCVDVRPVGGEPKGADFKRLGEFAWAAKGDSSVHFFQIETGPHISVHELQAKLRAEWAGKMSDSDLKYLLSKVTSGGSGLHIHIEFADPSYHTAYMPPAVLASR